MKTLFLLFITLFSVNAIAKNCDAFIDIKQGKTFKENLIIVEINGITKYKEVKGSLSDEEVQEKIQKWFDEVVKEICE